jgi:hypothetical protein
MSSHGLYPVKQIFDNPEASVSDRRVWVRSRADAEPTCRSVEASEPTPARVRNISRSGINLLVKRLFERGAVLEVEFPGASPLRADVVHVTSQANGEWSLGCAFTEEMTDDDWQASVTRPLPPGRLLDQRDWVRFPCTVQVSYYVVAAAEPSPSQARAVNICPSGVGLVLAQSLDIGALLNLEMHGKKNVSMVASVVHVATASEVEWSVGCEFLGPLSEEELDALM